MDRVLAIGLDITDFVEAQTRALQAERLATIGQTMTALAHESRNALQRIQASTEILELELGQNSAVSSDIRSISKAVKDLHGLLEEVRSFAAPVHLTLTPCCLAGIWRRAWHNLLSTRRVLDKATSASLKEHGLEFDTAHADRRIENGASVSQSIRECTGCLRWAGQGRSCTGTFAVTVRRLERARCDDCGQWLRNES